MVYELALKFKRKYPKTIAIRLKKHAKVVEDIIDKNEKVLYAFCGQRNDVHHLLFDSCVVALTNKRIVIGEKRAFFGYYVITVSPELFNDLKIISGLFWGKIEIDTVKENIFISNIDKKGLDEIETNVNSIMYENKKRRKLETTAKETTEK
jgi:hypothetical protein